jgi:hypothetical protein
LIVVVRKLLYNAVISDYCRFSSVIYCYFQAEITDSNNEKSIITTGIGITA